VRERLLELMLADGVSRGWATAALESALVVAKGLVLLELADSSGPVSLVRVALGTPPESGATTKSDAAETFAVAVRTYVRGLESAKQSAL
jgi:hypothetical protein